MTRLSILAPVLALATTAGPLLAHEGAHMHPHADDPLWVPVALGLAVIALAIALRGRFK
jgi:hypothetical protein